MIRSNLCNECDAYIHFKGTITVPNAGAAAVAKDGNKNALL